LEKKVTNYLSRKETNEEKKRNGERKWNERGPKKKGGKVKHPIPNKKKFWLRP